MDDVSGGTLKSVLRKILCIFIFLFCFLITGYASAGKEVAKGGPDNPISGQRNAAGGGEAEKTEVLATIFPLYDWARNVSGTESGLEYDGNAENDMLRKSRGSDINLTLLIDNGADMHSYQPSVRDILRIQNADAVIYVGGESDEWIEEALANSTKKNQVRLKLLDLLGDRVREEEYVEGMQQESSDAKNEKSHAEEGEEDEHVWLSLRNAEIAVRGISDVLCDLNPHDSSKYRKNADEYIQKLKSLDRDFAEALSSCPKRTLLFADRFPFRYLTEDYGLSYYAAFSGCSAETEASFETVLFLAGKTDSLNLNAVLTIEGSDKRLAQSVVSSTGFKNQRILTLNSMQSVNREEIGRGADYLTIMRENGEILKEALR